LGPIAQRYFVFKYLPSARKMTMEYETTLKNFAIFELKSFLGRLLLDGRPRLYKNLNYLHLGCGPSIIDGYVNADFFNRFQMRKRKEIQRLQWQLDLRFPLVCDDSVFEGVFTEHALEHLTPSQAKNLLKELNRVMKNNAIIRITVPDLEKYVKFYIGECDNLDVDRFESMYDTGCEAIRNTTQNYYHKSLWDFRELKRRLEDAGFKDIQKMAFGMSNDEHLKLDSKERAWETLYVEAKK